MTAKWNPDFLLQTVCAFLCAFGLDLFIIKITGLSLRYSMLVIVIACAVSMLFLVIITFRFTFSLIVLTILSLILLYYALFTEILYSFYKFITQFFTWLKPFLGGSAAYSSSFELTLFITIIAVISLLCFVCASLLDSSLLLLLLSIIPIIALSIVTKRELPYMMLIPSVFGIIILFSLTAKSTIHNEFSEVLSQRGYLQSLLALLPMIFIGMLVSFAVSYSYPAESLRSENVTNSTNDVLSALHLPLPSTSTRSIFNLGGLGYYPLHVRLGGPAAVSNDKVMEVTGSSDVLLRAATYDTYEKIFWSSSSSVFSSRFHAGILADRTKEFFDMNRPDINNIPGDLYGKVMEMETVTIKNLTSQAGSTIFSADHLIDVSDGKFAVYYNQSSEIFQNQRVAVSQTYSVSFNHFKTTDPGYWSNLLMLESYIIAHPELSDTESHLQEIRQNYLPVTIPETVTDYALSLTSDDQTPLEKVYAIREDLLTHFTYSLSVDIPPEDSDFVEYFLSSKTGYCTYFASAMTVMAKINGIPARYVEGFVVDMPDSASDESPATVTVRGKNGHAWCEVYINGIGWIPVDATASILSGGRSLSESNPSEGVPLSDSHQYIPPDEGYVPDHDVYDAAPLPNRNTGIFSAAASILRPFILPFVFVIILAACIFSIVLRRRWNRKFALPPLFILREENPPEALVAYLWNRCLNHLSLLGVAISPADTVSDFSQSLKSIPVYSSGCRKDTYRFDTAHIADIYSKWIYGRRLPGDDELSAAYSECLKITDDVRKAHKSNFYYRIHFLFGTGKSKKK